MIGNSCKYSNRAVSIMIAHSKKILSLSFCLKINCIQAGHPAFGEDGIHRANKSKVLHTVCMQLSACA